MKFAAFVFGCVLSACFIPPSEAQQDIPKPVVQRSSPWWVTGEFGAGMIKLNSDQQQGNQRTKFALGFAGGYQLTDWLRVGLHLNGWLQQAFDPYDPAVGESVSNVGGVADLFPSRRFGIFARAGYGLSMYTINRPTGRYGSGPGWEAGGGYEIPIHGRIRLAPMVEYASGRLGNGSSDVTPIQTGLHYSVFEFKVAVVGSFGHRRR
jgi:hypothetical protein